MILNPDSYIHMPEESVIQQGNTQNQLRLGIPRVRSNSLLRQLLMAMDIPLLVVTATLLIIGLMMVYSATLDWSYQLFGSVGSILKQQLRNAAIGSMILFAFTFMDYRIWKKWIIPALILTIALLVMVLFYGDDTLINARRSLIGGSIQPGEVAQLVTVVYLATWLSTNHGRIRSITLGLLPYLAIVGIIAGLIFLQPDLTTVAIIISVSFAMFFLSGATMKQLFLMLVLGLIILALILVSGSDALSYVGERVDHFVRGLDSLSAADYHSRQARIAFRNGGMLGLGIGNSLQKFAGRLPAPHTDYIFAILVEELGVVGGMAVIGLYIVFAYRGYLIALRAKDSLGSLLAIGITTMVITQAMVNIAVMASLLPASGVPLPFISYGGSSLVTMLSSVGLLLSVNRVNVVEATRRGRSIDFAHHDRSRRSWRSSIPRFGHRRSAYRP